MSYPFFKEPKNEMELLMGDVVRVLSLLLGKLWLSELSAELASFRISIERPSAFSDDDLKNAIRTLQALNVITTQKGLRATFEKPEPDILVGLTNSRYFMNLLESDSDLKKYRNLSKF